MTTTAFTHFAAEAGCLEYLLLEEIRHWLSKRGGAEHDGHHWIYKSAQELADRFGRARNTVAKALRRLVELGVLERQRLGVTVGHYTNRAWYYRLADGAPDWMKGLRNGSRKNEAVHCATAAQSNRTSTSVQIHIKAQQPWQPENQQPERKGVPFPGAADGLQKAIAMANSEDQPERDADGFLVRPSAKAEAVEQRVREAHPDATDEELEDLIIDEICEDITRSEVAKLNRQKRLDPVAAGLNKSGRASRRSNGFA